MKKKQTKSAKNQTKDEKPKLNPKNEEIVKYSDMLIKKHKLSINDFCDLIGIDDSTFYRWRNNINKPKEEKMFFIKYLTKLNKNQFSKLIDRYTYMNKQLTSPKITNEIPLSTRKIKYMVLTTAIIEDIAEKY